MARASRPAVKDNKNSGDVRTHIFKINTDANAEMFVSPGVRIVVVSY